MTTAPARIAHRECGRSVGGRRRSRQHRCGGVRRQGLDDDDDINDDEEDGEGAMGNDDYNDDDGNDGDGTERHNNQI